MDGRDFGPQRSVHGPPPPLLSGLAMDGHRVGAATAGRLPSSALPGPLPPGKYMAGLNLHPHPGKSVLRTALAPSCPGAGSRGWAALGGWSWPALWPVSPGCVQEAQLPAQRRVPGKSGFPSPLRRVSAVATALGDPGPRTLGEAEFAK